MFQRYEHSFILFSQDEPQKPMKITTCHRKNTFSIFLSFLAPVSAAKTFRPIFSKKKYVLVLHLGLPKA